MLFLLVSLPKYVVLISVSLPYLGTFSFLVSVHFLFHSGGLLKGSESRSTHHSVQEVLQPKFLYKPSKKTLKAAENYSHACL